ncbi:hypothetical protein H6P81_007972 [Aristolochia fimbriata]|uniref:Subtilisin-like protease SBT5.3 n=1 Tax=Aristolochia fimbriata TaxID=158543 RepID=A0AAV7F217_ARIFI|nr:hypothetical protein H6P81_007972 [Aristolochia fimbriata]
MKAPGAAAALIFNLLFMSCGWVHGATSTKHYIVYMGEQSHPISTDAVVLDNHAILASITGSMLKAKEATVHHYSKSFRGFSAMLAPEQARELAGREGVISVFESKTSRIHTTHSWDFLGLSAETQLPFADYFQSDVIVGMIDSGVWPESASFNDEGMGPVPKRFRGKCVGGENFTMADCNRKIIGARYYYKGFEAENGPLESIGGAFFRSPRDADGHGTHTASTAAGSVVPGASLLGLATGTARGGVTRARLAIYKACWFGFCSDADVFSAFDDAISDGVDVISVSLGPDPPQPSFFGEPISIGSFHAFKRGILTSASAGNSGLPRTACNVAPWILTVAASSIDRVFHSNLTLGDSKVLKGQSVNPLKMDGFFGIVPASAAVAPGVSSRNASFCKNNTLDSSLVKGKIVICAIERFSDSRGLKARVVKELGGVGMILLDPMGIDVGFQFVIPTTIIGLDEAKQLLAYLSIEKNAVANIGRTVTVLRVKPSPAMAVFSSMGPNVITQEIIKPDITAPGLNILAAWSPVGLDSAGGRSVDYNIISGTSMSCPHVSGAAAILKSYRPHWSPAAIKSALMTTATVVDNTGSTISRQPNGAATTPFDYGSGHMRPLAALNPGLIYDHDADDIINFLCGSGATSAQLRNLTGNPTTCTESTRVPTYNLNYPSIGVSNVTGSVSVLRTVTYNGKGRSVFSVSVDYPLGVKVTVVPSVLEFKRIGEKKSYRVDFVPTRDTNGSFVFGALMWSDGRYFVRSPIAVHGISDNRLRSHSGSPPANFKATISASIVDLVIKVCLEDFQATAPPPSVNTKPLHYIVYMGEQSHPCSNTDAVVLDNHAILASITGSMLKAKEATVHHYSKSFRGFSAMLTPEQARELAGREGVISVFESKTSRIHTTHSWDFLGLPVQTQLPFADYFQSDVIIGMIDSGVWPESASFNDKGMGPVPKRFRGKCVGGENFTMADCNRKIIGARYYYKGFEAENGPLESNGGAFFRSPRDADGHGTHTASTAAGSVVPGASLLGLASGTARGGATRARLAIYKACWFESCSDADVFSAFDDAISDGVDVISVSLGPDPPQPSFFGEPISIGSFHAFKRGILTSASAGNSGLPRTACNVAPWILTVAASSIDRVFHSNLTLGDSKVLKGQSVNPLKMDGFFGIVPASAAVAPGASSRNASFCKNNTLDSSLVKGKIVICTIERFGDSRGLKARVVKELGGVGMILLDPIAIDVGFQSVIPTTIIRPDEAKQLLAYLSIEKNAVANIGRTVTVLRAKPSPAMAVFSSMGPNVITQEIIKPDITAPGLNILAAWSPVALDPAGGRSVDYNIISGTSMSCPHVSGAAAILKSYRPHWSPAAIKSALMTTATVVDNTGSTISRQPNGTATTPFDYGSGHMRPLAALNPGLIYDHDADDIINFLCGSGATSAQLRNLTGNPTTCTESTRVPTYNLNYPSIGVSNVTGSVSVLRTVTYYGKGRSVFSASVDYPLGVKVTVVPSVLEFKRIGEKKSYRVDFVPTRDTNGSFVFGALMWSDGRYFVRSPIAVHVVSV